VELNQTTLRQILSAILNVDPKYVVPKQGNWWNPQDSLSTPDKPKTWCAYRIEAEQPLDIAYYEQADATNFQGKANFSVQHKVATISLQFVGDLAEDLAGSVGHWSHNGSVREQLEQVGGQLYGDSGLVTVSEFFQDGLNTVLSYNVRIRIVWASTVETAQPPMPDMVFGGGVV
jgi:hypothetical protein